MAPLFRERLGVPRRAWWLFLVALVIGLVAIHPLVVPLIVLSWFYAVARYARTEVRVDADAIWVGRRVAALGWLDPTTLGRARNPWPWRPFTRTYLGANPIWTSDSVRVLGRDPKGRKVIVAVGTRRRDELVAVLEWGMRNAQVRAGAWAGVPLPLAGWYDDPWAPGSSWRWWDGAQWTPYAAPAFRGRR